MSCEGRIGAGATPQEYGYGRTDGDKGKTKEFKLKKYEYNKTMGGERLLKLLDSETLKNNLQEKIKNLDPGEMEALRRIIQSGDLSKLTKAQRALLDNKLTGSEHPLKDK